MNQEKINQIMHYLILSSLSVLALGLFMSISFMALSHALIFIPLIYFLKDTNWNELKVHNWALIIFAILIPISIYYAKNFEHSLGLYNIMKFKYFLIGALSAAPITWWINNKANLKQIRFLFKALLISSAAASISGMIGWLTGFNPLKFGPPSINYQNAGMFGMSLSYAHSEALLCILLVGLIVNHKKIEKYVSLKLLVISFTINFVGFYTSYSRGAFMAFLIAVPFIFLKDHYKKFIIGAVISVIVFAIGWYFIPHFQAVFGGRSHSNLLRYGQWQAAFKVFQLNPIMGIGFRNFQPWSTIIKAQYGYPEPTWEGHAHNNFLEIMAGMGIVGTIPFAIWIIDWLRDSFTRNDLLGRITFPAVIVIIIGGLTQNTITDGVNLFFFMALYAFYNAKLKDIAN